MGGIMGEGRGREVMLSFFLLSLILLSLLFPFSAGAFQVSPAAKRFLFENTTISYDLRVLNDDQRSLNISLQAEGPLARFVTLSPSSLLMTPESGAKRVHVSVAPPPALQPGTNTIPIRITAAHSGGGEFGSVVSFTHTLTIIRLYNGSFLKGDLILADTPFGAPLLLLLRLQNEGTLATTVTATAHIRAPNGTELARLPLGTTNISGGGRGKLEARWQPDERGRYEVFLSYEDRGRHHQQRLEGSFRYGVPLLNLSFQNRSFVAGAIAPLSLPVKLSWNEPLTLHARLSLDNANQTLSTATTPDVTLQPGLPGNLHAFLEVPRVPPGTYLLRLSPIVVGQSSALALPHQIPVVVASAPVPEVTSHKSRLVLPGSTLFVLLFLLLFLLLLRWLRRYRA